MLNSKHGGSHARGAAVSPVVIAFALSVLFSSAPALRSQSFATYTYTSPRELDAMVSAIALYPDPLLSQVLAASTFPDEISDAARWADGHHLLTGKELALAVSADRLPWDGSVQALLPFPSVLEMMARDMSWTNNLGGAFLAQRADLMDAMQLMRQRARNYGYLRSNLQVSVSSGSYVEIIPLNDVLVSVPHYDSAVVYNAPKRAADSRHAVTFGPAVKLGLAFRPWGWGISKFHWAQHDVFTHRPAARYEPQDRVEGHSLRPRTQIERQRE